MKPIRIKIFGLYIYISDTTMRVRQNRDKTNKQDFLKYRKPYLDKIGWTCEVCGKQDKHITIHHILPYNMFGEYCNDERNMMGVCSCCHNEIHRNPFLYSRQIRKKCKELKIDYKQIYKKTKNG